MLEYNYERLFNAQDWKGVAEWCFHNDIRCWNGESYLLHDGSRLFPVYDDDDEIIDFERRL